VPRRHPEEVIKTMEISTRTKKLLGLGTMMDIPYSISHFPFPISRSMSDVEMLGER
jgi:hypothetical protein